MVTKELEIICKELGATPLTPEDEELFREHTKKYRSSDNLDFKDSWAYILQASRNLPYKIQIGDELVILGAKSEGSTIVIPNYFVSNVNNLKRITKGIAKSGLQAILKNVDPENTANLRELGFEDYKEGEKWDKTCRYDDQSFPQRVIEIESLMHLKGKDYSELKRELNRFRESYEDIIIRRYDSTKDFKKVKELIRIREQEISGFADAHKPFFSVNLSGSFLQWIFEIEGKIKGFTLCDEISPKCIAYNALVHDSNIPHLSSFIAFEIARQSQAQGYIYFNFQGSETERLDQWKRKFNPQVSINKIHLIYR
ncbi:MAG: hypothetical protein Q8N99_08090 [Nanoarchaeota archaeon]|nr:hypothetical protein [Nanoarchaeota archaeon]